MRSTTRRLFYIFIAPMVSKIVFYNEYAKTTQKTNVLSTNVFCTVISMKNTVITDM